MYIPCSHGSNHCRPPPALLLLSLYTCTHAHTYRSQRSIHERHGLSIGRRRDRVSQSVGQSAAAGDVRSRFRRVRRGVWSSQAHPHYVFHRSRGKQKGWGGGGGTGKEGYEFKPLPRLPKFSISYSRRFRTRYVNLNFLFQNYFRKQKH